jgi:hypothetical protein
MQSVFLSKADWSIVMRSLIDAENRMRNSLRDCDFPEARWACIDRAKKINKIRKYINLQRNTNEPSDATCLPVAQKYSRH